MTDGLRKKYLRPQEVDWKDNEKAQSAQIFLEKYMIAKDDEDYLRMKRKHNAMQKKWREEHPKGLEKVEKADKVESSESEAESSESEASD